MIIQRIISTHIHCQVQNLIIHNWEVFTLPITLRRMHHPEGSWSKLFKLSTSSEFPA